MHYYQHNIADYRKDTSHLSLLEHGIYRQLLDSYYLDEIPLPADIAKIMRTHSIRNAEEIESLKNVLNDFFELTQNGYIHKRCDEVIAQYHGKSEKAKASANARWSKKSKKADANAMRTQSEGNANHKPITINHKPLINTITPEGVSQQVWDDFVAQRKKSRAVISETVIKTIKKEADKAGWTLEQALAECAARGWRGFKAEWVKDDKKQDKTDKMRNLWEQIDSFGKPGMTLLEKGK